MTIYHARMMDAATNGEGTYPFEGPADLMARTADEIVTIFFDYVERDLLKTHADWEVNGIMKNKERGVVTAIGSLITEQGDPPLPFLLMISEDGKTR